MSARPVSPTTAKQRYEARKAERNRLQEDRAKYQTASEIEGEMMMLLFERLVVASERIADALEAPRP